MKQNSEIPISPREHEIARLVVQELRDKEIAEQLHISHCTVRFHIKNMQSKLGVVGRVGIAVWVVKQERHLSE